MDKIIKLSLAFLIGFVVISCDEGKPQPKPKKPKFQLVEMPVVSSDSVFSYVKKQVDFGPRIPNSEAADSCAAWMVSELNRRNFVVTEQKGEQKAHDGEVLKFNNIIGRFQPEKKNRIMLSAHWDTRPWADQDHSNVDAPIDGANDGASGVGVILEIARLINEQAPNIGVDVVLFDAEDYGKSNGSFCYGSQYWMKNTTFGDLVPKYGINLDMVGDPNAIFPYEGYSTQYARPVLDKVWRIASKMGHGRYFRTLQDGMITDDHYYVNQAGIPCIDIIHRDPQTGGFAHSWHTHSDNINNISRSTLKAVAEVLLQTIYREK